MPNTPPLAVSSWSLHRALGLTYPNQPDRDMVPAAEPTYGSGHMSLLEMPAAVAALGIDRVEICSFHIPTRDAAYLGELRGALAAAGVTLQTLLIEYGDLTNPTTAKRDIAWMEGWIDTAGALGAEQARVIAGKAQPTPKALAESAEGLLKLARRGEAAGVRIVTENWFDLLPDADTVLALFGQLDGKIGLNGDFGNWSGAGKYAELARIFGLAVCCHAKGDFSSGKLDVEDYGLCLDAATEAGFHGPYTLIYDGPDDDELANVAIEREFIRAYYAEREL
jgi:sugar phosphate isomerase/epimerase